MKIKVLELGADDYITKPFHAGELSARIRAVMRRSASEAEKRPPLIRAGEVEINTETREVRARGQLVHLTRTQFDLLRELASNPDRVIPYAYLLEAVWGAGYEDIRAVHVHICHLRRKLEIGPTAVRQILPVPGIGYRFRPAP